MRKTKIICTLGPASESESTLREMIKAGMNVARFNFSHGSYEEHQKRLDVVKKLRKELDVPLATLLDTKGPEIRLGKLKDGKAVLQEGNPFVLTTDDLLGDDTIASITFKDLPRDVSKGDHILIDDGLIELLVEKVEETRIHCVILNGGPISDRKGVNVPNVDLSMPYLSDKDRDDIRFGIKAGFNSSMFMVSELKIKDVTIDEVQNNYKIGYFGAIFMRFNIKKHFIQPEVSYNVSKCEITFDKLGSQHPAIEPDYASVQSVLHSVDFPILYGYNVVKKGPYGMSIFAGPKLRYLWGKHNEITFKNFDQKGIHERLYPFNVSAVIGVGVNISRIFFDFRYEQGIGNISKSIIYDNINSDGSTGVSNIIFRRRDSALSFSLGFIL